MNVRFEFILDGGFLEAGLRRYYRQRSNFLSMALKIPVSVLLGVLAILMLVAGRYWFTAFFISLIFLLFFSRRIDYWIMKRRLKKSPFNNSRLQVSLTQEGFHAISDKSDVSLKWSAFTRAVRFRDGFLLLQGPSAFNWLPQSAMIEGSVEEVDRLLKEQTLNYVVR